jgi:hypothetical protein
MLPATTAEVRLELAKSARSGGSVPSTNRFPASIPAPGTIYDCPIPPKRRSLPRNRPESGECRLNLLLGWTLIGWVGVFLWASLARTEDQAILP